MFVIGDSLVDNGNNNYLNSLAKSNYLPYGIDFPQGPSGRFNNGKTIAIHNLGLRKFLLAGVGPLGCIPNQLASSLITAPGKCVTHVNDLVKSFNKRLISLVDQLNANHNNGSIFSYGNTFDAFIDIINGPSKYGFLVANRGCCGVGKNRGEITCLPLLVPCAKRDRYVFWDAYHPTEAVNKIYAQRAYTGPTSDCYPVNIKQMAQM
uniref:GDSL esterase/lipase n=1 Tax=Kalanchoe fedtschenkoi TaxID=63787 RepID=A0A7N0VEC1_KALFE